MQFGATPEQDMIVETVRSFVEQEIYPLEDEVEVEDANERVHEFSSCASTPPRLGRVVRRARGDE